MSKAASAKGASKASAKPAASKGATAPAKQKKTNTTAPVAPAPVAPAPVAATVTATAPAPAKQPKTPVPLVITAHSEPQKLVLDAVMHRIKNAENENQAGTLEAEFRFFNDINGAAIIAKCEKQIDIAALAAHIRVLKTESKADFLAVYALQKVRKAMYSIANGVKQFDGYTNSILFNLCKLHSMNNKDARSSLSSAVTYTETEQVQNIRRMLDCNESTASTQASSTRMMLRALGICNVTKQKNGDAITFKDGKVAKTVQGFYANA